MAAIGEALLSAAFQVALEKLASPIVTEFGRRFGIDKDLKKLTRTLSKIQAVLNDAEAKQISNTAVKMWLNDLKEVAYDADDLLDEVATHAFLLNQQKKVTDLFSLSKDFIFKLGLAPKVKEINERLEEIAKDGDELGMKEGIGSSWAEARDKERLPTSSLVDESRVFGRIKDVEKLVKILVSDENCGNDVGVVPIVGMGGLGKTTLAQLVFKETSVSDHFEVKSWICVSDDFNIRRLTKSILESMDKKPCDLMDFDTLQTSLRDKLMGKKFLLVLDDVWNEKASDWEALRLPFRAGAMGSKIIVTTRSKKVASIMGSFEPYPLEVLSFDDCWSLFKQKAFLDDDEAAYPNLVPIGIEIVKKCQGLPLAAKALGGLLRGKTEIEEWKMILQSDLWELEDEYDILPALRLSYNNLPGNLKQCFAYCSIFPKDYNFDKESLVLLWIAEGFVHPKGRKRIEDVGFDYFEDLLLRSFFQQSKTNHSMFAMHDLIHDLAQTVAGEVCFRLEGESLQDIPETARHSSMVIDTFRSVAAFETLYAAKGLRTMLMLCNRNSQEMSAAKLPDDFFESLKCLRSLNMSHIAINHLPDSVAGLMHMRYLDLSHTDIKELPESICKLCNLQTLVLANCNKLVNLPEGTKDLVNLRHLDLTGCWHLKSMPPSFGRLKSLQRLHRFIGGREVGCGIGELKEMNELRDTLCIERVEDVNSIEDAKEAQLKNKQYIHKLALKWSRSRSVDDSINEELLECLEPHRNLRELTIDVYPGSKFPTWLGNPLLCHLESVEFLHCNYSETLAPLGQLPFLKSLTICTMQELKRIGPEFYGEGKVKGFPSLKKLKLEDMRSLKEWQGISDGEFPVLKELAVLNCPNLANLPKFPSIRDLVLDDCHESVLSSVHFLTSLTSLKIMNFRRIDSLPDGLLQPLTELKELKLQHFYRLKALKDEMGLQDLRSLQRFELFCCPKLVSLGEKRLPEKLQHLSIGMCSNLEDLPNGIGDLSVLQELNISKCPKFVSFPEEKLPGSLKNLKLSSCANLEALPPALHELKNLEHLSVHSCDKVACLPDLGLPVSLRSLSITECALLEERCAKGGEDWLKIEHVPEKYIRCF